MTERADALRTKREIAVAFIGRGSPRILSSLVVVGLAIRVAIGRWGWADVAVVALTIIAVGFVEWYLHRFVLHAAPDAWMSRTLGTGNGHREHHLDPPELDWLLLRAIDAAVFAVMIAAFTSLWAIPVVWLFAQVFTVEAVAAPVITAIVAAHLALAHYEWTHLLAHTRYRPRTRFYRRLSMNHRLHHFRNERYWLGITSNLGDRVLGTYPATKNDVPLSDTARTLL